MTKALFTLIALALAGCNTTANLKATPLKQQSIPQVDTDRKRCDEWAQKTAAARAGFAACMVAAGYEAEPEVGSTSQPVRLAQQSTATEPTRVLLDVLDCDAQARRDALKGASRANRSVPIGTDSCRPAPGCGGRGIEYRRAAGRLRVGFIGADGARERRLTKHPRT